MSTRVSEPRGAMLLTALIALVLHALPLPTLANSLRPAFVVLTVIYWSLQAPRAGGIALGFLAGLALDVFKGAVLGQYALATALVAYVSIRQHLLVRNKPVFEQTLFVIVMLLAWESVIWAIDGWSGERAMDWDRWLHVITGAMVWWLVALAIGRTHEPR
jgi:rod shape-determining protein MreD